MRISVAILAAALTAFRVAPVEAISLELYNGIESDRAGTEGFGQWIALNEDAVLVGSPGDLPEAAADLAIGKTFVFSILDGHFLRFIDRPLIAPQYFPTPGVLIDSYEAQIEPKIAGNEDPLLQHVSMGTGMLTWTARRIASDAGPIRHAVAIGGGRILIGAPAQGTDDVRKVRLYSTVTGKLLRTFAGPRGGGDGYGRSVAINGDLVLIGAPHDDADGNDAGLAYLYSASTGELLHRFEDPKAADDNRFGTSVAVSESIIAIGAPGDDTYGRNSGRAYLFSASGYQVAHILFDPVHLSWTASQDGWHRGFSAGGTAGLLTSGSTGIGVGGGFLGGNGGVGGSGGGDLGSWLGGVRDDGILTGILAPDPSSPDTELPKSPTVAPLPQAMALYLSALGMAALMLLWRAAAAATARVTTISSASAGHAQHIAPGEPRDA